MKNLDFRGVFLRPNEVDGRNWHDPYYEPPWPALEELEVLVTYEDKRKILWDNCAQY